MISVIVPVYNVEKYLNQCLDSILNQDFKDLEIICVNDGSTDSSLAILENYAKDDSRIKIISQENHGPSHARNVGLNHAQGEYVLFVDSDDFLSEGLIEKLYSNALSNNSDIVIFEFYQFDEDKGTCNAYGMKIDKKFGDVDFNNFTFSYKDIKNQVLNLFFNAWLNLYKKEFLDKFNLSFPENISYEDVLFHVKVFLYASRMSFLHEYGYNYRFSNSNSIMSDSSRIFDIIKVVNSVEEFLKDSSFFEEFKMEFYIFKITQLYQYITFWHDEDYFKAVKMEFILINECDEFDFNSLPKTIKKKLDDVLYSRCINDFL